MAVCHPFCEHISNLRWEVRKANNAHLNKINEASSSKKELLQEFEAQLITFKKKMVSLIRQSIEEEIELDNDLVVKTTGLIESLLITTKVHLSHEG